MSLTYRQSNSTCKGCEDRHVGCHATCERYKADRERREAERQEAFSRMIGDLAYRGYINDKNRGRRRK